MGLGFRVYGQLGFRLRLWLGLACLGAEKSDGHAAPLARGQEGVDLGRVRVRVRVGVGVRIRLR